MERHYEHHSLQLAEDKKLRTPVHEHDRFAIDVFVSEYLELMLSVFIPSTNFEIDNWFVVIVIC